MKRLKSTFISLAIIIASSSPAFAYLYPRDILKKQTTKQISLEDTIDGYRFALDIIPGKLIPDIPAIFNLQIFRESDGEKIDLVPKAKFSRMFYYLQQEDDPKAPPLLHETQWDSAHLINKEYRYQWQRQFGRPGDYLLDIKLDVPQGESVTITFYFTVFSKTDPANPPGYVGAKVCRWCHYVQYLSWEKNAKMSQAFNDLKPGIKRKEKLAADLDPERDYTHDSKCLKCHTTGYGKPGGFVSIEKTPDMANVQCESCHGPGEDFTWVMKRKFSFGHDEVADLGHRGFSSHQHTPKGHIMTLDPSKRQFCIKSCHNKDCPAYKLFEKLEGGDFAKQVLKGAHKTYDLKFQHWEWEDKMGMMGHNMEGLPQKIVHIALILILSLSGLAIVMVYRKTPEQQLKSYFRWDLFNISWIKKLMSKRPFQFTLQFPIVLIMILIVLTGLFGTQDSNKNFASLVTWNFWWVFLLFDVFFLGRIWCLICPWDALASWVQRLAFWKRKQQLNTQGRPWPRWLKNVNLATLLLIGFIWLELGFQVVYAPMVTAFIVMQLIILSIGAAMIFEKRPFCQYTCPVGRTLGLFSMFSPLELRHSDPEVCHSCKTKDCYHGNDMGYPCPTGQFVGGMETNTYCTLCTECIKSCPQDNISLNTRSFGADLLHFSRPRFDEALLLLVMLSISSFHGFAMTPNWQKVLDSIMQVTGADRLAAFSLGMGAFILVPLILYTLLLVISFPLLNAPKLSFKSIFCYFAYPLLAIGLFYHVAHNLSHIFGEILNIIPILSDPFGYGWNLFGTAGWKPKPIMMGQTMWWLQAGSILVGHLYALRSQTQIIKRISKNRNKAVLAFILVLIFITAFSCLNLWLLSLPMEMRTHIL